MKITTVGVKDIKFPVKIREKSGTLQETVASISLHADIPKHYRETCVSTFIAALNKYQDDISVNILAKLLSEVKDDLKE
jgi:GTP cyclohydrolase I